MVKRAMKFTPQVLLSAPRRSAGIPNASGTKVLYTISTYSFDAHKKTTELRVLDVQSGESHRLTKNHELSDFNWLNDDEFVCLQAEPDSTTHLYWTSVHKTVRDPKAEGSAFYVAGIIDAPVGDLKVKKLDDDTFAVVVSGQANPDGTLFNPNKAKKTHATGKLYSSLFVRHWDRWETKEKNALWFAKLSKKEKSGKWKLSQLTNALEGTGLESPMRPFGGSDNFDVSKDRIVFISKDPELNPALNTRCVLHLINVPDWDGKESPRLTQLRVRSFEGAMSSPVFSPDGHGIAFLQMAANGYESDRNALFVLRSVNTAGEAAIKPLFNGSSWDRSPQSITFSADGHKVFVTAEEFGVVKVFEIDPQNDILNGRQPRALTHTGSISDVRPLPGGHVFVSGSSITDNSFYAIVDPLLPPAEAKSSFAWTHSNSEGGNKFGLKPSQVSSIWSPASNPKINKEVHSIVVRPSNFDSSKKYPVAYIIHGGPQGAWGDSWSTRWNLAIFAEQGYVVVAPNPTGSTGYGQAFTDAIRKNWGGDPYQDIVNVFEWVGKNLPEADNDRAVTLGASYGGYMMNWIQGHDLGRKFKCIVCHDGITSFAGAMLGTEEFYFPFWDLGGTPWFDPGYKHKAGDVSAPAQGHKNFGAAKLSDWRKWDPSEHFANWQTPQLVIHSSKDYRLPIAEGLAAFNVLQARGIDSQFLTFPDENHWVLKPENSLLWHKVVLNWINKYAGLETFAEEGEDDDALYGGLRSENEEVADMPTLGQTST